MTDAITLIQQCSPNAYMAKSDIADAFRIVPLDPSQYHLTGFCWNGSYYYDRCLPRGCASSCNIFESISTAIKWILIHKLDIQNVVKVLDDFFFVGPAELECHNALNKFLYLAHELGIPVAKHKTSGPLRIITFLGIQLNTPTMVASLPIDKLIKYRNNIMTVISQDTVTLRELKSVIDS